MIRLRELAKFVQSFSRSDILRNILTAILLLLFVHLVSRLFDLVESFETRVRPFLRVWL